MMTPPSAVPPSGRGTGRGGGSGRPNFGGGRDRGRRSGERAGGRDGGADRAADRRDDRAWDARDTGDRGRYAGDRTRPARRPATSRPPEIDPARAAALELLTAVRERGAYANLALSPILRERHLSGRDAALATELGYGACRALGQLDAIAAACADRPLAEMDGPVLDAVRLGAYQLLHTRIPPHAAVSASVELVRAGPRPQAAGYVNAVLRRISERDLAGWVEYLAPAATTDPLARLGLATAHPRWIVAALADALGVRSGDVTADAPDEDRGGVPDDLRGPAATPAVTAGAIFGVAPGDGHELEAALLANQQPPAVHLVARPGLVDRASLAAEAGGQPGRFSPYAVYLPAGDPARLAAVRSRAAAVQDEGSQLVAVALATAALNGEDSRWLDLAAGPGGKAALLGALAAQRGAHLDAVEVAEHRAELVRQTTAGLPVTVHIADGRDPRLAAGSFDRVLLDAPCTGLGALRRRPEARWRRTEADVAPLVALQRELLASAARLVRPGGLIAYATCSPHLAETIGVIERRPDGLELIDARRYFPGVPDLGHGPAVQLWPHRHGTDAMFCALLRRTAAD